MIQLPNAFLKRMKEQLGDEFQDFINSMALPPVVSLRINPQKKTGKFEFADKIPWFEGGKYLEKRPDFVFDPLIHAGAYYVQEASSMFTAKFPDFSKDMVVLDLCAAPGGKSTLFLSMMSPGSILFSNEMVHKRAEILYENLVKWGSPMVVQTCNTSKDFKKFTNIFDVILVDAPCSGEGLFRKSPKYVQEWREGKSKQCAWVQKDLLETAFALLKEGGILIYATCTFSSKENDEVAKWFLTTYKGEIQPHHIEISNQWKIIEELIQTNDGKKQKLYKFYPHKLKGEGFFTTAFIKTKGKRPDKFSQKEKFPSLKKADLDIRKEVEKFANIPANYSCYLRDDQVLILPDKYLSIISLAYDQLDVMKAGIHAGTFNKKNRVFIPSHEMAMSQFIRNDFPSLELDEKNALKYLKKELINVDSHLEGGWLLAKYRGLALGWLKKSDKKLNNFYPRSWKIRKELEAD